MNKSLVLLGIVFAILGQCMYSLYQDGVQYRDWVGPNGFGWHSTAEEVSAGVDMTGKVALVTGGNGGLGFENCRVFALRGAHVVLAARTLEKANDAIRKIKEKLPAGNTYKLTPLACELSSLKSVSQAATDFKALGLPLHYLIANAGIMALPERTASADGYELQVATNHLGHFHLVTSLMDTLVASAPSRVVAVSSCSHENAPNARAFLESDTLELAYRPWHTYGYSKLANIIFAKELNERYRSKGVHAFSLHPGVILDTTLVRHIHPLSMFDFLKSPFNMARIAATLGNTVEEGTATQVYAALKAPDSEGGSYLDNCNVADIGKEYPQKDARLLDNEEVRSKFWRTSEKLVNQALVK